MMDNGLKLRVKQAKEKIELVKKEVSKLIVGQEEIVDSLIKALVSDGHVLVEGVPGLAKTVIVRTVAMVSGCSFGRIQFTADLLPTDIIGISAYTEGKGFYVIKGPVFANFILADEINRAPPKVQSALLESMQEKQVTIGKETFKLPNPFFVFGTQNPIESAGTYPLPEAQVDRFLFKILIDYPSVKEEKRILRRNITLRNFTDYDLKPVLSPEEILEMQKLTKQIYMDNKIERYIVKIVEATRNPKKYKLKTAKYIEWGASPRASIGLFIGAKATALLNGKEFVIPQHVKEVAHGVLRHRLLLNYEGQAEGITTDDVISEILLKIPVP